MKIKSINNKKDYTVSDSVFKVPMNNQVVYQCVVAELNNACLLYTSDAADE